MHQLQIQHIYQMTSEIQQECATSQDLFTKEVAHCDVLQYQSILAYSIIGRKLLNAEAGDRGDDEQQGEWIFLLNIVIKHLLVIRL